MALVNLLVASIRRVVNFPPLLAVALVAVCWPKGEPPRWRWGDDQRAQHRGTSLQDDGSAEAMKIKSHFESHIVELDDGSRWQIFPGDLDLTLNWKPETELTIVPSDDDVSSHMLMGGGAKVHVISAGESWPVKEVKSIPKEG